ncbi:MAG: PAS domain S-box protein [Leptolyngbyaceae cyanobacterium T60_A2020_046]|nr:PAS domain S-box protein [Leptolyngbyaceae cyanobacterium T60_A2020_046]
MCDRTLFEQTPALIHVVDAAGQVIAVSDCWLAALGYRRDEVMGRSWLQFLTPDSQHVAANVWQTGVTSKVVQDLPIYVWKRNGSAIAMQISARWVQPQDHTDGYGIAVLTDMTQVHQMHQELEHYRDRAAAITQTNQQLQQEIRDRETDEVAQNFSESRFRLIAETIDDVFWIVDGTTGEPLYVSPAIERIWGISSDRLYQEGISALIKRLVPEDEARFCERHRRLITEPAPFDEEYQILGSGAEMRWIRDRGFPVFDPDGQLRYCIGITTDITQRKQTELALRESEAQFQYLVQNIDDVLWVYDAQAQRDLYLSPAFETVWPMTREEAYGNPTAFLAHIHSDDRDRVAAALHAGQHSNADFNEEYRICYPDGAVRWVHDRGSALRKNGIASPIVVGVTTDITARKQAELVMRRYERIFSVTTDRICIIDGDGLCRLMNQACQAWSEVQHWFGRSLRDFLDPQTFTTHVQPALHRCITTGEHIQQELWISSPQHEFVSITYTPYWEEDGTLTGAIVSIRDLTALERTRQHLKATTDRLQLHIENSPLAVIEWDHDLRITRWSTRAAALFGWPADTMLGQRLTDCPLFTDADRDRFQTWLTTVGHGATQRQILQINTLTQNGTARACEWYNSALVDAHGTLLSGLSQVQDVSDRTQAITALKESEERWQLAILGSNDGIWDWKIQTHEVFFSPRWKTMLGYTDDEIPNQWRTWESQVHPEDLPKVMAKVQAHLAGHTDIFSAEHRIRAKDGQYRWFLTRGRVILDETGTPVRMVGSHTDITDCKQVEEALRSSQQLLQLVFDTMPQRVFWKDQQGHFIGGNRQFAQDMGLSSPADLIGKGDGDLPEVVPDAITQYQDDDRAILNGSQPRICREQLQRHRNGTDLWVRATKLPLKSSTGEIIGVFCTYEDISEQRHAKAALQRYVRMVEVATDGICLLDRDYRYQIINPTYAHWYGYSGQPILGHTVAEVLGQDAFATRLKPLLDRCLAGETLRYADWFTFPHLGQCYHSVTLTPYVEDNGTITGIVTSIRDLTELRQAELCQQNLQAILESTPDAVGMATADGQVTYLNSAFRKLVGATSETYEGEHIDQFHPAWAIQRLYEEALPTAIAEGSWQGELAILDHAGEEIPVSQTIAAHFGDGGEVVSFSTIIRDTRDRKRIEAKLYHRLQFEHLLGQLSTQFVDLPSEALTTGIHHALRDITEAAGAERSYVFLLDADQNAVTLYSQWHLPTLEPLPPELCHLPQQSFSWLISELNQRHTILLTTPDDLPAEALNERAALDHLRIQSAVLVPMFHSQVLQGFLGFATHTHTQLWSQDEVALLQLVGNLFANAYRRHQVDEALRQQQNYFQALTEQTPDIVVLLDHQGCFQYVTPSAQRVLGYQPAQLIGQPATDFVAPEDVDMIIDTIQQAAANPGVSLPIVHYRVRHQDGSWRYFEAIATSLLHDPVVRGIVVNCRNVSDRARAHAAQQLSEREFQAIFEQSAVSMAQLSLAGSYLRINPAFCTLLGYPAHELLGRHYAEFTHPDDLENDSRLTLEVVNGTAPTHLIEKRFICRDGSIRYVQSITTAVCDSQGQPIFLSSVYNDITDRVLAESALRNIVIGTAAVTGTDFFAALAKHLATSLEGETVLINQLCDDHLTTLAFWSQGTLQPTYQYPIPNTPCEYVLRDGFYLCTQAVQEAFPCDRDLVALKAESYIGIALTNAQGTPIGEICVIHREPLRDVQNAIAILKIFAARAAAELERQRSHQALRDSEARFQRLADNMPGVIYRYHTYPDGRDRFSYVSAAARDLWGLEAEAIYQDTNHLWRLVHPEDVPNFQIAIAQAAAQMTPISYEHRIITPAGLEKWCQAISRPAPQADGSLIWDGLVIDITERKATERALRHSEAVNRAIVEALPDMVIRMNRDGDCLSVKHPSEYPVVVPEAEAVGRNIRDMLPPEIVHERMALVERAIATQHTQLYEYQITVHGTTRWEEGRIVPMSENEVLLLIRDISERKQAEHEIRRLNHELEQQNQHLEDLVEQRTSELLTFMNALPDQIFVIDRATNQLTFGNDVFASFTQRANRQAFQNKSVFECFPPEQAAYYDAQNQQVFATGEVLHMEEAIETPLGLIHLDTYKIPLKRPDGSVYAIIGSSRDITELVHTRQALEQQTRQLAATNQELESFAYSVSHDLRAPLRHINGFITALQQRLSPATLSDPKISHYIHVIAHSSEKMGLLIDGLLTLSRVGRRDLILRPVALSALVNTVIEMLELSDDSNTMRLTLSDLPTVQGDAALLQQVFMNLIQNAVKFSRDRTPAEITIGYDPKTQVFYVQDNGVGFDMSYADKLFTPFQRLHTAEQFEGTGIGLAIVQRIIHRHHGTIWVESQINQGTTFFFTLG